MTKFQFARIAAATAVAALSCSLASAADNYTMAVTATVVGTCALGATPNLDFGTLDQVLAPTLTPSAAVTFRCTKNTVAPTVTVGGSTSGTFNGSMASGGNAIVYTLGWTPPVAAPLGFNSAAVTLTVTANLVGTDYQNAPAGSYAQNVAISITP